MTERVEYRVAYRRDGIVQYQDGFPKPDLNWGSYFHNIRPHEVIGWQKRTIGEWGPA